MAISRGWIFAGGGVVFVAGVVALLTYCDRRARRPVDADGYLARGLKDAPTKAKGVELSSIDVTFVTPDGLVHTEHGGKLLVEWVAAGEPATTAAMPGAPRRGGASCTEISLHVFLDVDEDAATLRDAMSVRRDMGCWRVSAPGPLHCTIVGIWKRAIAAGAPNPALARIELRTTRDGDALRRTWQFRVVDQVSDGPDKTLFSADFPDDCASPGER